MRPTATEGPRSGEPTGLLNRLNLVGPVMMMLASVFGPDTHMSHTHSHVTLNHTVKVGGIIPRLLARKQEVR